MEENKQIATEFMKQVVAGNIDEAYKKYVNLQGKHHNIFFSAGFSNLKKAMKDNNEQMPIKELTIKNVLCDNDLVAVHSNLIFNKGETDMITFHLFRIKNKKIIEMWDCGQIIKPNSPNKDGAF